MTLWTTVMMRLYPPNARPARASGLGWTTVVTERITFGMNDSEMPSLGETYELVFLALIERKATPEEALEFHRLLIAGPSSAPSGAKRMARFLELKTKFGIGPVKRPNFYTLAEIPRSGTSAEVVSEKITVENGVKRLEVILKFPDKPKPVSRSRKKG